jgi:hypothetical protein
MAEGAPTQMDSLSPQLCNPLRAPYKEVNRGTDDVCEDNNDNPDQPVITFTWLLRYAVDQHPNPECCPKNSDAQNNEQEKELW